MTVSITVSELAAALGVDFEGAPDHVLTGVATLSQAGPSDLSFLANGAYRAQLSTSQAGAVICHPDEKALGSTARLLSSNPYATWAKALNHLHPRVPQEAGIAPSAVIDPSAHIDPTAHIGPQTSIGSDARIGPHALIGPGCVVAPGAQIGAHTQLVSRVYIGPECQIGQRVVVHPGAVIGADGFGLAMDEGQWQKVPQLGRVVIGDDCEIGANTTIDRGALDDTVLAHDVRIDNQVQIAHNVRIGAHTAIAGCVGIAGSTEIGAYCMIAGACGIGGHLTISDHVVITAMSTVLNSIDSPGSYGSGIPAQSHQHWKRILVRLLKLDDWISRIKFLEKGSKP